MANTISVVEKPVPNEVSDQAYVLGLQPNADGLMALYRFPLSSVRLNDTLQQLSIKNAQLDTKLDVTNKTLSNVVELLKGHEYSLQDGASPANIQNVPIGAQKWASLLMVGGKSEVVDGQIIHGKCDKVISKGMNLWDEQWKNGYLNNGIVTDGGSGIVSKNLIPVEPGKTYFIKYNSESIYYTYYDANGAWINTTYNSNLGRNQSISNSTITIPSNVYFIRFNSDGSYGTLYKNDICINISDVALNGIYKPYKAPIEYPIPAEIQALDGYGWSAGSVYNYIDFTEKKYYKKVGKIDLGSLSWSYQSQYTRFVSNAISDIKSIPGNWVSNLISSRYLGGLGDKYISSQSKQLYIFDSAFTDATAFKVSLSGVMLYYELGEVQIIDISEYLPDDNFIEAEAGGSVTFHQQGTQLKLPNKVTYMVRLEDAI